MTLVQGRHATVTKAEISEIKKRAQAGETYVHIGQDFRQFSLSTVAAIANGKYDDRAIEDNSPLLTDRSIQKLLSFPTPEQAVSRRANEAIAFTGFDHDFEVFRSR